MTWERQRAYDYDAGYETKAVEDAKNLLALNKLTIEEIAQCCSLPVEQVISLKNELELKTS